MLLEKKEFKLENLALEETLFHVANGYLGLRASIDFDKKDYCRGLYINGFHDISDIEYGEKFIGFPSTKESICKLADVQSLNIYIDSKPIKISEDNIKSYYHKIDLSQGFAERYFNIATSKGNIEVCTRRLASFVDKQVLLLSYEITPHFDTNMRIESILDGDVANFAASDDPRVASQAEKPMQITNIKSDDNYMGIDMIAKRSKLRFACSIYHNPKPHAIHKYEKSVASEYIYNLKKGTKIRIEKFIRLQDTYHFDDINIKNHFESFEYYFAEQKNYLDKFWNDSRIIIHGDENLQNALDYSIYSLMASVGRDDKFSVSAKGLSGEGYEGHVFWDSEVYVSPLFVLTNPEIAKSLLSYRHNILPYAKNQAKLLGHDKGALYAWRSIEGPECSAYFPSGSAQYHINNDVCYTLMQYFFASNDIDFLENKIFDILLECSRLWIDIGHFTENGFCINEVTGPDEYTCLVDNNFYTNVGAKNTMQYLLYTIDKLKEEHRFNKIKNLDEKELDEIKRACNNMYLPYDKKLKINPQDDSFLGKKALDLSTIPANKFPLLLHYHPLFLYRHQVCKQADVVLAHALYNDCADIETKRNSFKYYEKICTHDSSLSLCAYAIMASQLGMTDLAEKYFKATVDLDINNTHKNTMDGIHTANMGGSFLVISKGFAGVYMDKDGLNISPNKTNSISGYEFNLLYHNRKINLSAKKNTFTITLVSGDKLDINVYGKKIKLIDKYTFEINA